ncbi:putative coiled-coil domain-containing protein 195 [Paralichthys olivaceus]|uniref:putative coiled-coil domain-containing protein 195 n=1 Tax=Paralichthys olivaceus TaxID=8255 RepID=UPI0037531C1B
MVLADHRSPFSCISGERRHNLPQNKIWTEIERERHTHTGKGQQKAFGSSMLNPQPQGELLLRDSPSVFGKPWFWQRSSSTMESTRSLAQVIMEMRDDIKKLEAENQELRGDNGQRTDSPVSSTLENPYVNLRRNVSAPVLEGQYKENAVMTVRRYSISSNLSGVTLREGRTDRVRRGENGWRRLQEEIQHGNSIFVNPVRDVGKVSNRHSLQEYVHKNRAKVKTVTFLLPVDDIYTNRPVLSKHQEEPKISELASIMETDS